MVTVRFYRRGDDYYVDIDGKPIKIEGLRPIDYLLIALAYGLGTRYLDKYGIGEYVIKCEIEGDNLRCEAPCSGLEDRCFVNRLLTRGRPVPQVLSSMSTGTWSEPSTLLRTSALLTLPLNSSLTIQ